MARKGEKKERICDLAYQSTVGVLRGSRRGWLRYTRRARAGVTQLLRQPSPPASLSRLVRKVTAIFDFRMEQV